MESRGRTAALLVAAGVGRRVGADLPKQYQSLAGQAVLAHALDGLQAHDGIDLIQVVIAEGRQGQYSEAIGDRSLPPPIVGGATRHQSVRNGLAALAGQGVEQVLIHDAARPFLPAKVIDRLLEALTRKPGAVPVLPVVDTLAARGDTLGATVDRERLVRVQTPQAFRFDAIRQAHAAYSGSDPSDDAQVARAFGLEVEMVMGDEALQKLTFADDFRSAETRLMFNRSAYTETRSGLGFDVHAFGDGDSVRLGGLNIPHQRGLSGHSDADVVLHALTDALLGALGAGDIGDHFPPSDPKWRGAESSIFVEHARSLAEAAGARIVNVDITIICEAPRIGPHRTAMCEKIAGLLRLPLAAISVKATTTEGLGLTGRREGIAAQALANIEIRRG